jgi:hypothetical protein
LHRILLLLRLNLTSWTWWQDVFTLRSL